MRCFSWSYVIINRTLLRFKLLVGQIMASPCVQGYYDWHFSLCSDVKETKRLIEKIINRFIDNECCSLGVEVIFKELLLTWFWWSWRGLKWYFSCVEEVSWMKTFLCILKKHLKPCCWLRWWPRLSYLNVVSLPAFLFVMSSRHGNIIMYEISKQSL